MFIVYRMVWIKWVCILNCSSCFNWCIWFIQNEVKKLYNRDSTFTPVPATITPAGLELDPDTPATLENNQAEN